MASTDIDGTPILILRPEQARLILGLVHDVLDLSAAEQALLDKVQAFLKEVSDG